MSTHRDDFSFGITCKELFDKSAGVRTNLMSKAREIAELTIPSVAPPTAWQPGDDLPNNNQSIGAYLVNNLASTLMLLAFPPGLPMLSISVNAHAMRDELAADPDLAAEIKLSLVELEAAHQSKLRSTQYIWVFVSYLKLLLIVGNGAWKHYKLHCPTFYTPDNFTCERDNTGQVRRGVTRDKLLLRDLDDELYAFAENTATGGLKDSFDKADLDAEIEVYTGVKLKATSGEDGFEWQFWQEVNGQTVPGTEFKTPYDAPAIRFDWMVPMIGHDWGNSYCGEYRGDLFSVETWSSGFTDGIALATWMLAFVDPASRTDLRQVKQSQNLAILPGRASDVSILRPERYADLQIVDSAIERASQRLARAFLAQVSIQRNGERVTKAEIDRLGAEVDKAMGGLYSGIAQSIDRPGKMRFLALNEEATDTLPKLPEGLTQVTVSNGVDAMGASREAETLLALGRGLNEVFGPQGATEELKKGNFTTRLAASLGVSDPVGLVRSKEEKAQEAENAQQQQMGTALLDKGTGPLAGAMGKTLSDAAAMAMQGQQAGPPEVPR